MVYAKWTQEYNYVRGNDDLKLRKASLNLNPIYIFNL